MSDFHTMQLRDVQAVSSKIDLMDSCIYFKSLLLVEIGGLTLGNGILIIIKNI